MSEAADALTHSLLSKATFPAPGTEVDCAVSGGADSTALLVLACKSGCRVTAWHVDHGLRPGSSQEADVVSAIAQRFGAAFESRTATVPDGPNVEARARSARRSLLPPGAMTGHTADDQAETMLINLMRGAGIEGLAGMRSTFKPILQLRRADTEALCRAHGIEPLLDPMNDDDALLRNRVRHELIPLMDELVKRDVREVLARQSGPLRSHVDLLDRLGSHIDPSDARALAEAPLPVATHVLRNWIREKTNDETHPPDRATIERAMRVVRAETRACELPGGKRLERSAQRLRIIERE